MSRVYAGRAELGAAQRIAGDLRRLHAGIAGSIRRGAGAGPDRARARDAFLLRAGASRIDAERARSRPLRSVIIEDDAVGRSILPDRGDTRVAGPDVWTHARVV